MPNNSDELERLHTLTIAAVIHRVENGSQDDDGNYKPVSNDDLRLAAQLLKQNNITANLAEADNERLKVNMAKKCDFSAIKKKLENSIT